MVLLKSMLLFGGFGLMALALAVLTYDLSLLFVYRRAVASGASLDAVASRPLRWRMVIALLILGWMPLLLALGFVLDSATVGSGPRFVPLAEDVAVCSICERTLSTAGPQASARKGVTTENQPSPFFAASRRRANFVG
jgi:hypothetical protein